MRPLTLTTFAAFAALSLPALAQDMAGTANLMDQSGTSLGTVTLTEMDGGVHLTGDLTGVPNGEHGFHIHETGTCDAAAKFESAGAHFEPAGHKHGTENPEGPHAGDLMNVTADDDGKATVDLHNTMVRISTGAASLDDADGSALVLHADPDDYKTDPSGNSGDRIACGVIEFAQ
jgi:Cu-Zn family superoxide dismutase